MPLSDIIRKNRLLVAITIVGVLVRLVHLFQPIRYDEAITYLLFVKLPLKYAVANYRFPNNHIFHTVLVKGAVALLGNAPWILRIPAFLAGCAIIPLTYRIARRVADNAVALLAAALTAGSGVMVLYSSNARGYTLITAATLTLVWILLQQIALPQRWHWPAFAVVAALGLWTIPVMLYPLGGALTWALWDAWSHRGERQPWWRLPLHTGLAMAASAALALLCYTPLLLEEGPTRLIGNGYVTPQSPEIFFLTAVPAGLSEISALFALGIPAFLAVALLACAVVGVVVTFSRRVPLILPFVVWGTIMVCVMRRFPFARVWVFLIPLIAIAAADGFFWLAARLQFASVLRRNSWVAGGVAIGLSAWLVGSGAVFDSRETGTLRDAPRIAEIVKAHYGPGDQIRAQSWAPLAYELERIGMDGNIALGTDSSATRLLLIANTGEGESVEGLLEMHRMRPDQWHVDTLATLPHATVTLVTPRGQLNISPR